MNRFIPFAAMLLSVSVAHPANMLDLRTGVISKGASREIPTRTVEHTEDGIIVSYKFSYANIDDDRIFPGHVHWDIPGFSVSTTPGSPELPGRTDSFVVPNGVVVASLMVDGYPVSNMELTISKF